jgi:hypothetical protein
MFNLSSSILLKTILSLVYLTKIANVKTRICNSLVNPFKSMEGEVVLTRSFRNHKGLLNKELVYHMYKNLKLNTFSLIIIS